MSWSLNRVRVGAGPGIRPEGWLGWSAHPFGDALFSDRVQYSAFALDTSKVAVGLLAFLYLVVHNLPQLPMHPVIFSSL